MWKNLKNYKNNTISIYRGNLPPEYSENASHRPPVKVSYGVRFVS